MADTFRINGSYTTQPLLGELSGAPLISCPIDETVQLINKLPLQYTLDTDNVQAVSLGGLTAAHIVFVRAYGSKIRLRLTSADGATQAVPVDPLYFTESLSVPFTAIDIMRAAGGVSTLVEIFLGQRA